MLIEKIVENKILMIRYKESQKYMIFKPIEPIKLELFLEKSRTVSENPSCRYSIYSRGIASNEYVNARIVANGDINFKALQADILDISIIGTDNIYVSDVGNEQSVVIIDMGNYKSINFNRENTVITISGSGNSEILINKFLVINISGFGEVNHKGEAETHSNVVGVGSLIRCVISE